MDKTREFVDKRDLVVTNKELEKGISKYKLYSYLKNEGFEKISHGVYAGEDVWVDESYVLQLRCPNCVFSHDEALYYYGLTDREPAQQTITVYTGYSTSRLVKEGIKVYTVKKELLDLGKIKIVNSFGHQISIYNLERTICDLIRSKKSFDIQDFQTALRQYVKRNDKDLNQLIEYAKAFHIDKKVREYMEVLL